VSHVIENVLQIPYNSFTTLVLRKLLDMLQEGCKGFQPPIVMSDNPSPTELKQTMKGSIMEEQEES
jgi:hypothetical protein